MQNLPDRDVSSPDALPDVPPEAPPPPPIPPAPTAYASGYAPAASGWQIAPAQTSGQAVAALILSAVGLVGGWLVLPLVASVAGIVLGHLALGATGRAGGYLRGRGLAIAALVCGYGAVVVWLGVWLV